MADTNQIKKADLARAREIDFVYNFVDDLRKLFEVLDITRQIPKQAGTNIVAYKATGELQDGSVPEGENIPLSKYKTEKITFGEIPFDKWQKETTIEAIASGGYDQAVTMTTNAMLKDAQSIIKSRFFKYLANGTGEASGNNLQEALAQAWGQLQVKYEDTTFSPVYFINPLDIAGYLANAPITLQNAFGMSYISDFLGLGTVITNSNVPQGTIYATAKENIVVYYIPVNGADIDKAFDFTSDETGFIGIHEQPDYDNLTSSDTVMMAITLFAERLDGVVKSTIGGGSDLGA